MTDSRGAVSHIPPSLAEWLGAMPDDELAKLLRLRPDLTTPIPASLDVLAGRAMAQLSIVRAADDLDTAAFIVLEVVANGDRQGIDQKRITSTLTDRGGSPAVIDAALQQLQRRALVWGDRQLCASIHARTALPWSTSDSHDTDLTTDEIITALAEVNDVERALLDHLTRTTQIGRTRDAAAGTPPDRPVQRLLAKHLLEWIDDQTVALPDAVAAVLRGEYVATRTLNPPEITTTPHAMADVDGAAAGEVLELLRHCRDLLDALGTAPAPVLKSGGLGVREIRRLSKHTGIDSGRIGLLVEVLAAADLLAAGAPDPLPAGTQPSDELWAPTIHSDSWSEQPRAQRWAQLAQAWLTMPRQPWLIGMRDVADKPIAALSEEAGNGFAPRDRATILHRIASLKPGHSAHPDELVRLLLWCRPRWGNRLRADPVAQTMAEATTLGILGRGALTTPGRVLLNHDPTDAAPPIEAMARALPSPVDYVMIQADLTVVAPGPLTQDLERALAQAANLESAGGAAVYRISENTVRRSLDTGTTAAQLHTLFEQHSRTPVPQTLTYLIDDVARRHGALRVGVASAFLRSDDPARLAEVIASPVAEKLALRLIAPTVAISPAPPNELLDGLRAAGFAPAAEDSHGAIVSLQPQGARVLTRRSAGPRTPHQPSDAQLQEYIRRLRANDRAARSGHTTTDLDTTGLINLLQTAAHARRRITIGYVDAAGIPSRSIVEPLAISGGRLDAVDPGTGTVRHFALHRITSAGLAT